MHDGKVFRPHLALSYYLPSYIAKSMKLTFETLNYDNNTIKCRYAHASSNKELHVDLRGRMIQRLVNEFPDTTNIIKNLTHENDVRIPTVDVVVVPVVESPCYETVVRAIVPRNVKPDSLTVSMYNMSSDDYSLLRKLDNVRIMFGQKSHFSSFSAIASRTKSDLIILIDGHIKVPALYIEKSISAYLDNKNAIYCATAANLSDSKQNIHGGNISEEKINIITQEKSKNYTAVDVLLGGLYVMSRATFLKILNTDNNITNFVDLSHIATKLSIPLLCMNNLVVDHNRKIDISTLLTHQ